MQCFQFKGANFVDEIVQLFKQDFEVISRTFKLDFSIIGKEYKYKL